MKNLALGVFVMVLLNCAAYADSKKVVIVELFTSEGCSSCPPSEKRLTGIEQNANSDTIIIPIEWHVDYWDYLGWKDPFSSARATERQYQYAKSLPSSVYTPEMVVNGIIEAPWFGSQAQFNTFLKNTRASDAKISLEFGLSSAKNPNECMINLKLGSVPSNVRITAVLIESGLSSTPTAGENNGAYLKHSNIARRDQILPNSSGEYAFAIPEGVNPKNAQIVLLVQDQKSNEIVLAKFAGLPSSKQAASSTMWKGRLIDKSGRGVSGVQVQACNDLKCIPARTNSEGNFSFESLTPGTYTLAIGKKLNALKFTIANGTAQGKVQTIVLD